ncbi:MAG: MBL fold metallo-hydrolase [Propionibacteriaceae bacterium]|jgi:glyoxylase-like metal-dependent hydrolase (beta-lactamase superfamily II)|nr:MBL fold metallo-hydrolase [Propionibacteriaceae bacterium]
MTVIMETPLMVVRQRSVGPWDNNVFMITAGDSGEQILVDAADDTPAILELIESAREDGPDPRVVLIMTTHSHEDHIEALADMVHTTKARTAAGREDASAIEDHTGVKIEVLVDHGSMIEIAGLSLSVISLRGHTPGSVALVYQEENQPTLILTGDSLFPGGVGNTDQDPQRFTSLFTDVTTRIFDVYSDDTIIWPGHGTSTTLGKERPHLQEWYKRGW